MLLGLSHVCQLHSIFQMYVKNDYIFKNYETFFPLIQIIRFAF
jgi:hypothetical protein